MRGMPKPRAVPAAVTPKPATRIDHHHNRPSREAARRRRSAGQGASGRAKH